MITVIFAPKGGTGKTTITHQLKHYLPSDTRFLDLDYNKGLSQLIAIEQPEPEQITDTFLNELLPSFYDNQQHLIIDASGYATSAVLNALARADNIIIPLTQSMTTQHTLERTITILDELSRQIDYTLKAKILWNGLAWNASVSKLNEMIPDSPHLEPLPFAIIQNSDLRKAKRSSNQRVIKAMELLTKEMTCHA